LGSVLDGGGEFVAEVVELQLLGVEREEGKS
jgi:hypothetical protein